MNKNSAVYIRTIRFLRDYYFQLSVTAAALLNFIFMVSFSPVRSLWYDDIYQIFFIYDRSFGEMLDVVLKIDMNPPLFHILSYIWIRIVPYGTAWLKLLSEIAVFFSIIVIGYAGKEAYGAKEGIVASVIMSTSTTVILFCGYSFRAYGYVLLFSSLLLLTYIRCRKNPSFKTRTLFFISVFLLAATHYFGMFTCLLLGCFDLIRVIMKKESPKVFLPYIAAALLVLPWYFMHMTTLSQIAHSFWPDAPGFVSFAITVFYMCGQSVVCSIAFPLGIVGVIILICTKRADISNIQTLTSVICAFLPTVMLILIFIYSAFINPDGSVWVDRYFITLIPFVMLLSAKTSYNILLFLPYIFKNRERIASVVMTTVIVFLMSATCITVTIIYIYGDTEEFEDTADEIMSQEDIYDSGNVLVFSTTQCGRGWVYYISRGGERDMTNITVAGQNDRIDFSKYDTIYVYSVHPQNYFDLNGFLNELSAYFSCESVGGRDDLFRLDKK